ncbi:MAG: SDR family oxidoreductase [Planctomycetota bacterium]
MSDKVALITGAGSGIGEAVARRFAAEGAAVVLTGRRSGELERVASGICESGGRAEPMACDVRKPEDCARVASHAEQTFGGLDILVNNAGILKRLPLLSTDIATWEDLFRTNATGPFLMIKESVPKMIPRGGGSIVNVSTIAALVGFAGLSAYGASKGALLSLTRAAAVELGARKIRVNAVCPGAVDTLMNASVFRDEAARAKLSASFPLGRPGTALDVAEAILYLASEESAWATGMVLTLDGGFTAA